jgi:DNA-binding LacI/PurR family transcriptional regulator
MATIKDVARQAGVSVTTVSRVLNNHPYVGDDLRQRVLQAIDELGYKPNRVAQRLRATNSQLVGVIFSDIANPFYIEALRGIEQVLSRHSLSVLIGNADSDHEREEGFIRLMQMEEVAGLIIAPTREDAPVLAQACHDGLAVVVIDRRMTDCDVDSVLADNFKGSLMAVRHLIQLGHKRIGVVSGPLHLTSGRERYAGYLQAMSDADLPVESNLTRFGNYRQNSGYRLTHELLELPNPPSALFIGNNEMTIGALNAIHESGWVIPDDIAVIGCDDLSWAVSLNPPLTTVAQPTFDIGVRAADMLLARMAEPDRPPRTVVLETQLLVRESCGEKKQSSPDR